MSVSSLIAGRGWWVRMVRAALIVAMVVWAGLYAARHPEQLEAIGRVSVGYTALLILSGAVTLFLNGVYIRKVMQTFDLRLSALESTAIAVYSGIGNYLLPLAGGLGARGVYLKQRHRLPYASYFSTVGATYVLGVGTAALIGLLAAAVLYLRDQPTSLIILTALGGIALTSVALGLVNVQVPRHRWKVVDTFAAVLDGWYRIRSDRWRVVILVAIILAEALNTWAAVWIGFSALGVQLSIAVSLLLAMLFELSILVRITPAGLGVREAVLTSSGTAMGIGPVTSVLAAVLLRATGLFANLLLALVLGAAASARWRRPPTSKASG